MHWRTLVAIVGAFVATLVACGSTPSVASDPQCGTDLEARTCSPGQVTVECTGGQLPRTNGPCVRILEIAFGATSESPAYVEDDYCCTDLGEDGGAG